MASSSDIDQWDYNTVPAVFWQCIANAQGDVDSFKNSVRDYSAEQLRTLQHQYAGLAKYLVLQCFSQLPAILQEESMQTLQEIANWVITQGKAHYEQVLTQPQLFPQREDIRRPIFAGAVIEVYIEKFGAWRS